MPMPNATVATMTSASSSRNASWLPAALVVGQAGVVRQRAHAALAQPRGERVDLAPRRAVDDARLAAVPREDVEQLPLQVRIARSTR